MRDDEIYCMKYLDISRKHIDWELSRKKDS